MLLSACGRYQPKSITASLGKEKTAALTDYEALYAPILEENLEIIQNGYDYETQYKYVSNGIIEEVMYAEGRELLQSIGYVIMDISGDSIPELLIGKNADYEYDDKEEQSYIYSIFTIKDDKAFCVIDGWARSSHVWMGNGYVLYTGSNGAAYSLFGKYHLSHDGTTSEWDDFYFTDEDPDSHDILYYHNTEGIVDPKVSEKLDIQGGEFWSLIDDSNTQLLTWTSIGAFESSNKGTGADTIVNDINKFTLDFYMWYHSIIRRYHIYEQPQIQHRSRSALATR